MAFSFSTWFKGKPAPGDDNSPADDEPAAAATSPGAAPVLKLPTAGTPSVRQTQPVSRAAIRSAVPNAMQPVNLRGPEQPRPPAPLGVRPLTAAPATPAAPAPVKVSPVMPTARKIAFGGPGAPASPGQVFSSMPAGSLPAGPEPSAPPMQVPEFTVALTVGDFIDRLPPGLLAASAPDRSQTVEFASSEFYSDLSKGRACVPASVIYEKCPAIFARPVSETEDAEVALPLQKVVEQMSAALQTRLDQVNEETGAEIETPFLHVANEDNARLPKANGTTVGALPGGETRPAAQGGELPASVTRSGMQRTGIISAISPVKAPAEATSPLAASPAASTAAISPGKRPPSTVRASVAGGKIRLSGPSNPAPGMVAAANQPGVSAAGLPPAPAPAVAPPASSPSHQVAKKTARIQIPPISLRAAGTPPAAGPRPPVAFAPPAASPDPAQQPSFRTEPPMPNFRSAPPAGDTAASTFRTSPPPPSTKRVPASFAPAVRPSFPPPAFPAAPPDESTPSTAPATAPGSETTPADDRKIQISLTAILRGLPSSSLTVSPSSIPDSEKVSLPFSLIENQLSKGRVVLPKAVFIEALPEAHRGVLADDADLQEIPVPLQEVFQNLPANALTIRADQVIEEATHTYPTPFSQKADEDAQRLGMVAPVQPASSAVEPEVAAEAPAEESLATQDKAAQGIQIPEDAVAPTAAKLIDTEDVSTAKPTELAVDAAHEEVTVDAPTETSPAELPALPAAAFTDQTETGAETSRDGLASNGSAGDAIPLPALPAVPVEEEPVPAPEEAPLEPAASAGPVPPAPEPAFSTDAISSAGLPPAVSTEKRATQAPDTILQTLFMTEDDLDAKAIVKHINQLPGIDGCAIMFGDGLPLAGNFPDGNEKAGFSAMTPPFFKRTLTFADSLNLGGLEALTLYTANGLLSFFMHGDICVSVRHTGRGFLPGVREKLDTVTRELARIYSTEKPVPADAAQGGHPI